MRSTPERVHKLKQPLHLISMQAEILLYKEGIDEQERRKLLFRIVGLATELNEVIDRECLEEAKTPCPHCGKV
jgi:light-regulated signal transduction histidine kinase (bacteriophytochrome)